MFHGTSKPMPQWEKAFPDNQIDEIRSLYRQGISTYDLADRYYCHRATIWKYVKDIKDRPKTSKQRLSEARIKQIRAAKLAGTSVKEIARLTGVCEGTVKRYTVGVRKKINLSKGA